MVVRQRELQVVEQRFSKKSKNQNEWIDAFVIIQSSEAQPESFSSPPAIHARMRESDNGNSPRNNKRCSDELCLQRNFRTGEYSRYRAGFFRIVRDGLKLRFVDAGHLRIAFQFDETDAKASIALCEMDFRRC